MTTPSSAPGLAVITGGSGGIGAATARRFVAQGMHVALLDLNDAEGAALVRELGATASYHRCDVSDATFVEQLACELERALPPIRVLVSSAALIPNAEAIMDMDLGDHDRMWRVNYFGTLHVARSFGRRLADARQGNIVTVGSINTMLPLPLPAYNPGKVAIARLTQLLAVELGRHGVRVNSVAPTYVMTPALRARIDAGLRDEAKMMQAHALPYLPTPDDVASAIAFLCSEDARCITGVTLPIDSGWGSAVSYKSYAGGVPWET